MREADELTVGIRARTPHVLEGVVREYLPRLLRAARAAGLPEEAAEDAVQSTFLTFVRRCHEFDGRARVGTWLYGILIRKVAETRRDLARESGSEDIDAVVESRFDASGAWARPPRGPEGDLAGAETLRHLEDCLAGLTDRQRLAFALRELEGLGPEEVCKVLEVSRNNLGVLLFRARNRLRECLERKGIEGSEDAVV
ncbi:MAG: RNA polymerase sigma factor [Gemmatimonadales bacterium]